MKKSRWMMRCGLVIGTQSICGLSTVAAIAQTAPTPSIPTTLAPPSALAAEPPSIDSLLANLAPLAPIAEPPLPVADTSLDAGTAGANTPFQFVPPASPTVLSSDPMAPLVPPALSPTVQETAIPEIAEADLTQPTPASAPAVIRLGQTVPDETDAIDIAIDRPIADSPNTDSFSAASPNANILTADALAPLAPPPAIESPAAPSTAATSAAPLLSSDPVTPPSLNLQGSIIQVGDEFSARARLMGYMYLSSNVLVGATVDLSTGDAFSDTDGTGLSINELYVAAAPSGAPNLRFVVGQLDLTSYFDRNSFAKDSLTHFFNPVFQTNPALAATQLESQPAALVNWRATDNLTLKAATFSSGGIDDFSIDGFVGEVGLRLGDLILRGTYVSATDAGSRSSFPELFQSNRGNGIFGTLPGDREVSYGVNAEWFIPTLNMGVFGRYGYQENQALNLSGQTYSGGINIFDLFMDDDRLGIGYGWGLSNDTLRQEQGGDTPDVFEVFYDVRLAPNIRAAVDFQQRNSFSETYLGVRIRADVELLNND